MDEVIKDFNKAMTSIVGNEHIPPAFETIVIALLMLTKETRNLNKTLTEIVKEVE